jgi:hypothetical protein
MGSYNLFTFRCTLNLIHLYSFATDEQPGGTLLFTGATSATRGAAEFATFAAGKMVFAPSLKAWLENSGREIYMWPM